MTSEHQGEKVCSFSLSPDTVARIREDVNREVDKCGNFNQAAADSSKNMPIFVTIPLEGDRALVGVQEENTDGGTLELKHEDPSVKLEPLSLVSSAFFVGRGSCYVKFVSGDYSIWIHKPGC